MKTLTCRDLGGPCEVQLTGETFEAIGQASHAHVMECVQAGDVPHKEAMEAMMHATPEVQEAMMVSFKKVFDEAPAL